MKRSFDESDPTIDVLLRNRLGSDTPPDLVASVQRDFERGDGSEAVRRVLRAQAEPVARPFGARLLAAALVLLGLGVVVATQWAVSGPNDDQGPAVAPQPTPQDPQRQDPKRVDPRQQNPIMTTLAHERGEHGFELRVVDHRGGPVQDFTMSVLRVVKGHPMQRVRMQTFADRQIHPRDFKSDFTAIEGLPAGEFAVAVTTGAYVKTISAPFTIEAGEAAPRVRVTLVTGGEVTGVVLDADGKPVVGAIVRTQPNQGLLQAGQNPFTKLLGKIMPDIHTIATARTDAEGRFALVKLIHGDYSLKVSHPDFCESLLDMIKIGKKPQRAEVRIVRGIIVRGTASLDGNPAANLEISVTPLDAKGEPRRVAGSPWKTATGEDGAFQFPTRLPPGKYTIRGHTLDVQNPFQTLLQMQNSTRTFTIDKDTREIVQDVSVSSK